MSCDYQRNRIWCSMREYYRREIPANIRDQFESTIEDFVTDWIKDQLEKEGNRVVKQYQKTKKNEPVITNDKKRKTSKGGTSMTDKKKKKKTESTKPLHFKKQVNADPPFEEVYRLTKDIIMPGHVQWQDDQRDEMAEKMRRVMRWMRVHGDVADADPIHGKHHLPRISSVAAYAAVHDWLTAQGVVMTSNFDPIYAALKKDRGLNEEQVHDLGHLLEKLEIEMNRKKNASPEQLEEILTRIYDLSPDLYGRILKRFPRLVTASATTQI